MTELLTAAQMRAIECAAIESGEVTGLELMERAGRGTVEAILAEWPELASGERRAVVLCGPGNNGGDGFVVARLLRERGWAVEVFLYGDAERLPPDARVNWERWGKTGNSRCWDDHAIEDLLDEQSHDLVVDGLFGIGLTRPMPDDTERTWHGFVPTVTHNQPSERPQKYVALDIPSGLDGDSGANLDGALPTDLTVTYHRAKLGHYLGGERRLEGGPAWCGTLRIVDIGLTTDCVSGAVKLTDRQPSGPTDWLRKRGGHKYDHGHAVVLSGGVGRGGAARMAARGALRIGAGLVTLGCPPAAVIENAAQLDAIMLRQVKDGEALAAMLEDRRIGALCLGPGLGTGERETALVRAALGGAAGERDGSVGPADRGRGSGAPSAGGRGGSDEGRPAPGSTRGLDQRSATAAESAADRQSVGGAPAPEVTSEDRGPGSGAGAPVDGGDRLVPDAAEARLMPEATRRAVVLDGDALSILARFPDLFALLHERCVLTPHAGEFARLFPDLAARLDAPAEAGPAYSKVDAVREAAARAGCVVVFKGPDTVIADPSGRAAINSAHYERSAPWLATAGSGDVLAGFVAGLLARGFEPMQAAEAGAWLHVECALEFGPGLIAEDLPEMLPAVFRRLGL